MGGMGNHIAIRKSLARRGDLYAEATDVPVWTDLQGNISQGTGNAALTYEAYRDTNFKLYFLRYSQADELNFVFQMPHEWDPTTDIRPHLHFIPMADPAAPQIFALALLYSWSHVGAALPANVNWVAKSVTKTINPGDVYKELVIPFGSIVPPTGAKESDLLLIQMKRDTTPDTYETGKTGGTAAANVAVLSCDVHYRKVKLGTAAEFPRTP
jgi:hypothetical protein